MLTWIIGAGGLLGSALMRKTEQPFVVSPIAWHNHEDALPQLKTGLQRFKDQLAKEKGAHWSIVWAAGKTSTASSQTEAENELKTFKAFTEFLAADPPSGDGCFALASSAGGIYSGSSHPPFDASTEPNPTGIYGHLKLAQERDVQETLAPHMNVLIARLANLYGPGQDLSKLQGFISRLAFSAISKEQVNVFVSLDTLRDYIYVDDAAALLLHWIEVRAASGSRSGSEATTSSVRLIGSGEPISLGFLINLVQDVTRTKIPIAYGSHASASNQARDLRLIPDQDHFTRKFPRTALPAGIKNVYLDLLDRRQLAQPIANSLG